MTSPVWETLCKAHLYYEEGRKKHAQRLEHQCCLPRSEATIWHADAFYRVTAILSGGSLAVKFPVIFGLTGPICARRLKSNISQ